jgi:mannose-6-phosphate isomerase-like protein (cupin superfamily)
MEPYFTNIEEETLNNENYRKVLFTSEHLQLVVMSLKAGEDIPEEVHNGIDQFIRVESGSAKVIVNGEEYKLGDDDIIIIPAGTKHYVKNTSEEELKLYSIYTPAEHKPGTIHRTREEAIAYEKEHGH